MCRGCDPRWSWPHHLSGNAGPIGRRRTDDGSAHVSNSVRSRAESTCAVTMGRCGVAKDGLPHRSRTPVRPLGAADAVARVGRTVDELRSALEAATGRHRPLLNRHPSIGQTEEAFPPLITLVPGPLGLAQLPIVAGEDGGIEGTWNQFGRILEPTGNRVHLHVLSSLPRYQPPRWRQGTTGGPLQDYPGYADQRGFGDR